MLILFFKQRLNPLSEMYFLKYFTICDHIRQQLIDSMIIICYFHTFRYYECTFLKTKQLIFLFLFCSFRLACRNKNFFFKNFFLNLLLILNLDFKCKYLEIPIDFLPPKRNNVLLKHKSAILL